ncbi:MAG: DUF4342 domain-containing protein [Anaerolineae bacterium]|nr:DUF4342 domain-containing protein [Anaerolineae bacterium]
MSEDRKQKRKETFEFSTQDVGKRLQQLLEDINAYQVILRRQDGSTIVSLPGLVALVIGLVVPQLALLIVIAHLLDLLKVAINRRD